jgi:hypothetical protein
MAPGFFAVLTTSLAARDRAERADITAKGRLGQISGELD